MAAFAHGHALSGIAPLLTITGRLTAQLPPALTQRYTASLGGDGSSSGDGSGRHMTVVPMWRRWHWWRRGKRRKEAVVMAAATEAKAADRGGGGDGGDDGGCGGGNGGGGGD